MKKKAPLLKTAVAEVFVASTPKYRTYIAQFTFSEKSFTQKELGTLGGFFMVRDKKAWSANIVHFLTTELKKEYFARAERGLSESFEAALHHTNRALAELAKNDNVDWIGNISSAICAYNDGEIHLAVTGDAAVLLLREGELMEISAGLASEHAHENPLKTFVDTASGKFKDGDIIIITSSELLELIPTDELHSNALNFTPDEFVQFVSTVLTNECDMASTHVLRILQRDQQQSPVKQIPSITDNPEDADADIELPENAFSATAYKRDVPIVDTETQPERTHEAVSPPSAAEMPEEMGDDYVDKRTGHIYVKGDDEGIDRRFYTPAIGRTKDLYADAKYITKTHISGLGKKSGKAFSMYVLQFPKKVIFLITQFRSQKSQPESSLLKASKESRRESMNSAAPSKNTQAPTSQKPLILRKIADKKNGATAQEKLPPEKPATFSTEKTVSFSDVLRGHDNTKLFTEKKSDAYDALFGSAEPETADQVAPQQEKASFVGKMLSYVMAAVRIPFRLATGFIDAGKGTEGPSGIGKVGAWFAARSWIFWLIVGTLILLLIAIPAYQKQETAKQVVAEAEKERLEQEIAAEEKQQAIEVEKNANTVADPAIVAETLTPVSTVRIDEKDIILNNDKITVRSGSSTDDFPLPDGSGTPTHATAMGDLSLVFFFTDEGKLYSFSPKTETYSKQSLPDTFTHNDTTVLQSFLTNIYFFSEKRIIRYARTDGGFKDPKSWLTDDTTLNGTTSAAIDGKVYIAKNGSVEVFESNKTTKKRTAPDIKAKYIFTNENVNLLWVLDTENGVLHSLNKTTLAKQKEFKHSILANTIAFTVDEKANTALITTADTAYKLTLKNL